MGARKKKKPGRNVAESERHTRRVTLRLSPNVAALVRQLANELGITLSEVVERAVVAIAYERKLNERTGQ